MRKLYLKHYFVRECKIYCVSREKLIENSGKNADKKNSLLKILNDFPNIYIHEISVAVIGDADIWPNQKNITTLQKLYMVSYCSILYSNCFSYKVAKDLFIVVSLKKPR